MGLVFVGFRVETWICWIDDRLSRSKAPYTLGFKRTYPTGVSLAHIAIIVKCEVWG